MSHDPRTDSLARIAVLGNHLPRQCGIATFTTHIADALSEHDARIDCFVLAMNDADARYAYPRRVRFEIAESDLSSYRRAADFLNVNQVDVLSVQHEYGIFGGKAGAHVFALLRELRMPIVTTLHTVLGEPSPAQRASLEGEGSEDSHGRALWALGATVGRSAGGDLRTLAGELFAAALPAVSSFTSPRAWAFTLLGIAEYLGAFDGDRRVQALGHALADRLLGLLTVSSRPDWSWFEDRVTYCNAHLPQALVATGAWTGRDDLTRAGLRSLEWLASIQRSPAGVFAPIGSNGFYPRDAAMAAFDQQPVEAYAMVSACVEAQRVDAGGPWARHARHAFDWFLGGNHLQYTLYDPSTGGCRDGLHAERANENQGAESTLSFLLALIDLRVAQRADVGVPSSRMVAH